MARFRFHGHDGRAQERFVIQDGIARGKQRIGRIISIFSFPRKHTHGYLGPECLVNLCIGGSVGFHIAVPIAPPDGLFHNKVADF